MKPTKLPDVAWRDLVALTPMEKLWELTLSLPWLAASIWFYELGFWPAGLMSSFYFFLTGLRQSHNAQHYAIGLSRRTHDIVLFALSALMLASMHAVQVTHLHHHRHCLDDADVEGATARKSWWRTLAEGPLFPFRLQAAAWRLGNPRQRAWIAAEAFVIGLIVLWAFAFSHCTALQWHVGVMLVGECFTAFFAVWTVHHDCDKCDIGRTQRGALITALSYGMLFHVEHHLFPAVPTRHLAELARRIDAVTPRWQMRRVLQ